MDARGAGAYALTAAEILAFAHEVGVAVTYSDGRLRLRTVRLVRSQDLADLAGFVRQCRYELVAKVAAEEVEWRVRAMLPQMRSPFPFLAAREGTWSTEGRCASCGDPIDQGGGGRCDPCGTAAVIALERWRARRTQ